MCDDEDLESLVLLAQQRDEAALERLLLDNFAEVETFVERELPARLRCVVSTEDILQETFVGAFRDIAKFKFTGKHSFVAWLRAIANNRILDEIRKFHSKKRPDKGIVRPNPTAHSTTIADLLDIITDDAVTASGAMAKKEAIEAIQIATAGLPNDHREAIQLHHIQGKTIEEVASEMQHTTGAVRGFLQRGRDKLRAAMGRASAYLSNR